MNESGASRRSRCFFVTLAPSTSSAVEPGADLAPLLSGWRSVLREQRFSGVVSVRQGERTIFEYVGNGDQATARTIREDDVFWIGSVSKQFAAAAVLRLVEQGRIALDTPVTRILPALEGGLRRDGQTCTVEHLLSHTCGLPAGSKVCSNIDSEEPGTRARFLECVRGLELEFTPGTDHLYAGTGFALAGLLVAEVSGRPYAQFLEQELLRPLGMMDTGVFLAGAQEQRARLGDGTLYLKALSLPSASWLWLDPVGPGRRGASGNLYSTAADLHRWNQALHGGKVLGEELYRELTRPRKKRYGLGIATKETTDGAWLWHNGALFPMGWTSYLAWVPGPQLSVVVLSNRGPENSQMDEIATGLIQSAIAGAAPKLDPVPDTRFVFDGFYALIPLIVYALLLVELWLVARGPRKTATGWMISLVTVAAGVLLARTLLDFYGDHAWLAGAQALLLAVAIVVHRGRWTEKLLDDSQRRLELRRVLQFAPGVLLLLWATRGDTRTWFAGTLATVVVTAVLVFLASRRKQALAGS